jgi:hypothetical protein
VLTSFTLSRVSRLSDLLDAGDEERTQPISQRKIVIGNSSMMIIRLRIRMSLCVIASCPLVFLFNLLIVFVTKLIHHMLCKSMALPCYDPAGDQSSVAHRAVRYLLVTTFNLKAQEPGGKDLFVLPLLNRRDRSIDEVISTSGIQKRN